MTIEINLPPSWIAAIDEAAADRKIDRETYIKQSLQYWLEVGGYYDDIPQDER